MNYSEQPFYKYVDSVLNGREVVGHYIRRAVERFVSDCDRKDYAFDYDQGAKFIKFARLCYHWKGPKAGTPIYLDPHQHFYLIQKYGWIDTSTGLPRFSRTYKQIARKTGKTTEGAVESIYHMSKGIEEAAQVWTCATKEDDAIIIVNDAGRIVQASPLLKPRFKLQIRDPYVRRVIFAERSAFMAYMTKGQDAVDTSMGIGDECHDWPDASVKQRIESSMGNRIAPSFTNMTTAGFDKLSYCFKTLRDTGIKILDGIVKDDNQLIMIYEMDQGDNWQDETAWLKSNPDIPFSSTKLPNLKRNLITAINEGGSTEANFKTKHLNIWIDAPTTFINAEIWDSNSRGGTVEELHGEMCYAGVEVGPSGEISAVAFLFPGDTLRVRMFYFMAEEALQRNDFYREHRKYIRIDPGNEVDNDIAVEWIVNEFRKYNLHSFSFPNTQKSNSIIQGLIKAGYQGNPIAQGLISITNATTEWEKEIRSGNVEHYGDPILRYMNASCVAIKKEAGTRIEKKGNVLGIYACINALDQWKAAGINSHSLGIIYI